MIEVQVLGQMKEYVDIEDPFGFEQLEEAESLGFTNKKQAKSYKETLINPDKIDFVTSTTINGKGHAIIHYQNQTLVLKRTFDKIKRVVNQ